METAIFEDFKFVPLMFVTPGFGSQIITLIKDHIPWFRDPNPRVHTLRVQRKTPLTFRVHKGDYVGIMGVMEKEMESPL